LAIERALLKSSVSPSLLARIAVSATEQLSTAQGLFATRKDLDEGLQVYVREDKLYAQAIAYRYMGQDAEKGKRTGEAVVWYASARDILKRIKSKGLAVRVRKHASIIDQLYASCKKLNDTVMFDTEPALEDLTARMPSGRAIVDAKEFVKPQLAFALNADSDDEMERKEDIHETCYAGRGEYY
jgi:hypothetical protein